MKNPLKHSLENKLDDIYANGIIERDGLYVCSVCNKEYKRPSSAKRHFEARTCFSYANLFRGTMIEMNFFQLHKKVSALDGRRGLSMNRFRGSTHYNSIVKLYVFCKNNNVDFNDYFDYLIHEFQYDMLPIALSKGRKESQLRLFRKEAQQYTSDEKDERFFNGNEDWLGEDTPRTIRALERGDISIEFLFSKIDFDEFVDKISRPELERLTQLLKES